MPLAWMQRSAELRLVLTELETGIWSALQAWRSGEKFVMKFPLLQLAFLISSLVRSSNGAIIFTKEMKLHIPCDTCPLAFQFSNAAYLASHKSDDFRCNIDFQRTLCLRARILPFSVSKSSHRWSTRRNSKCLTMSAARPSQAKSLSRHKLFEDTNCLVAQFLSTISLADNSKTKVWSDFVQLIRKCERLAAVNASASILISSQAKHGLRSVGLVNATAYNMVRNCVNASFAAFNTSDRLYKFAPLLHWRDEIQQ